MEIKSMDFPISLEGLNENGVFEGYASVFNHIDGHNDVIVKGAFTRSLAQRNHGEDIKFLWQHNADEPIGFFYIVREDEFGLYVKGQILLDVTKGKEAYSLLKFGAVNGLSIGYKTVKSEKSERLNARVITELDLFEISLVTFPANDLAKISNLKTQEPENSFFEKSLIGSGELLKLDEALDKAISRL